MCSRAQACMAVSHLGGGVWEGLGVQVSMMDEEVFQKILGVLSTADGVRRDGAARSGTVEARDSIGDLHLLLFGYFFVTPTQGLQSKQTSSVILSSSPRPLGRRHSSCCPGCTRSSFECSARIGRRFYLAQPKPHPLISTLKSACGAR